MRDARPFIACNLWRRRRARACRCRRPPPPRHLQSIGPLFPVDVIDEFTTPTSALLVLLATPTTDLVTVCGTPPSFPSSHNPNLALSFTNTHTQRALRTSANSLDALFALAPSPVLFKSDVRRRGSVCVSQPPSPKRGALGTLLTLDEGEELEGVALLRECVKESRLMRKCCTSDNRARRSAAVHRS
jgi:hypothetical protein